MLALLKTSARAAILGIVVATAPLQAAQAGGPQSKALQIHYQGVIDLEAHFRRPGEIRSFGSEQRFYQDSHGRVRLDWTTWPEGDTTRIPETYLVSDNRVFHRDSPDSRWQLLEGERAGLGRLQALAGLPKAMSAIETQQTPGVHMYVDHIYVDIAGGRLLNVVIRRPHPRLGDVRDSVVYTYPSNDPKETVPKELLFVLHERDQQWRLREHEVSWSRGSVPESLFAAPADFDSPAPPDTLTGVPDLVQLAPGVWCADLEDISSRSVIAEFSDYLAVIEFAVGSANGERLVDAARRRWPAKPVRYAFFSHYHPHYAGGVRAMIAEGATVVTTPGNQAFVEAVAALPFTIQPDRLARSPRPVKIQTFSDRFELEDSTNQLVAINYGDRSQHTDEFVVFWFPRAKLLFETELGWVDDSKGNLRASRRAAPLLAWLDEQKLDVERLVQSWPMRGNPREVSRAQLDSLSRAARR